jgi:hypothetical protein
MRGMLQTLENQCRNHSSVDCLSIETAKNAKDPIREGYERDEAAQAKAFGLFLTNHS